MDEELPLTSQGRPKDIWMPDAMWINECLMFQVITNRRFCS